MTRDQVLLKVYDSGLILKYANYFKTYHKNYDDFSLHLFLILCELPEDKLIKMYEANELLYYMFSVAKTFAVCKTSDYWKLHKGRLDIDKNIDISELNI